MKVTTIQRIAPKTLWLFRQERRGVLHTWHAEKYEDGIKFISKGGTTRVAKYTRVSESKTRMSLGPKVKKVCLACNASGGSECLCEPSTKDNLMP